MVNEDKSPSEMSYKELFQRMNELTMEYVEEASGWDKVPKVLANMYRDNMFCLTNEFSRRLEKLEKLARQSNCLDSD